MNRTPDERFHYIRGIIVGASVVTAIFIAIAVAETMFR